MLVIFLDVEHNRACDLHFCQQVEVSQDEKDFALGLELLNHVLLIGEEVVILVLVAHVCIVVDIARIGQVLVLAVLAISERENIVPTLDHEQWEVKVGQLKVDISDLADILSLCASSVGGRVSVQVLT